MSSRLKPGFSRPYSKAFQNWELLNFDFLLPRLWAILLVLAPLFFVISADYFEKLERSGTGGAIIADTVFSAMLFCYVVLLLYVLKQRRI